MKNIDLGFFKLSIARCQNCGLFEPVNEYPQPAPVAAQAAAIMRDRGWTFSWTNGYRCPDCKPRKYALLIRRTPRGKEK